jgi:preprotein translocase subunit SecD
VFSIVFYSISGIFAFITLLYNLVFTLLGLAWLQMPLTLPGIAGIVLTVGMAIDASVIIFEHIREELAHGVTIVKAVKAGFAGALVVILDANITTFIVGVVLYNFGTGPIQGFAITMMLGIISTLITGLFFLRSLFMFMLNNFHVQKLRI